MMDMTSLSIQIIVDAVAVVIVCSLPIALLLWIAVKIVNIFVQMFTGEERVKL